VVAIVELAVVELAIVEKVIAGLMAPSKD